MKFSAAAVILNLYERGFSIEDIARIVNKNKNSVRNCIKKSNISPTEMKGSIKTDCFAFKPNNTNMGECDCLIYLECKYGECPFYKTRMER